MKRKLGISIAVMAAALVAVAGDVSFGTLSKVTTGANVPIQLTATTTWVSQLTFIGMKAARTNNTGAVYIQATNTTNAPAIPIAAGATFTIASPDRQPSINLTNFWIEAPNSGDGVQVFFLR